MPDVRLLSTPEAVRACFPIIAQLRPQLGEAEFVAQAQRQMAEQHYHLAAVYDGDTITAVAGYRLGECLAWGRYLYVDDLITDQARRGTGHGGLLFDWLVAEAKQRSCQELHLDSGVHRFAAHRFYLAKRMEIRSHHFALELDG